MKYVGMKYMIVLWNKAYLSNDVSYIDYKWYRVGRFEKSPIYSCVRGDELFTLTDEVFTKLIMNLHHTIYRYYDSHVQMEVPSLYDDEHPLEFSIFFGGMIKGTIFYCPKNILRAKYVTAIPQGPYAYAFVPCDANGVPYTKKHKYQIKASSYCCNLVYDVIKANPGISTPEVIRAMGWNDRQVTPRLSELLAGGRIKVVGKTTNPESGRAVSLWEVV